VRNLVGEPRAFSNYFLKREVVDVLTRKRSLLMSFLSLSKYRHTEKGEREREREKRKGDDEKAMYSAFASLSI
jgi:hypothetical protein